MSQRDEQVIDLACVDGVTIQDIADRFGVHRITVAKFFGRNRSAIKAARAEIESVGDRKHVEVLTLWGESVPREEIATRTGLSVDVVRRLILAAELDEQPDELGASLELLALQAAYPGRLYEDDLRALTECGGHVVRFGSPDAGLRRAA